MFRCTVKACQKGKKQEVRRIRKRKQKFEKFSLSLLEQQAGQRLLADVTHQMHTDRTILKQFLTLTWRLTLGKKERQTDR